MTKFSFDLLSLSLSVRVDGNYPIFFPDILHNTSNDFDMTICVRKTHAFPHIFFFFINPEQQMNLSSKTWLGRIALWT